MDRSWFDGQAAPSEELRPEATFAVKPRNTFGLLRVPAYEQGEELFWGDWGALEEGHFVLVQRDSHPPLSGEVDVVADDASVFWVWLDNGYGRIAVYVDEGIRVWLPRGYSL